MDAEREETGIIPRLVAAVAHLGFRFPWLVLLGTALSCGLALWYTCTYLSYENQRNDLHSKDKAYYQRWQQYVKEFGDDDDMVVVVRGQERGQMVAALEDIAGQLSQQPDLYDRLFYKVDLRSLHNRALLFLPADQIGLIQDNLQDLKLLLEPYVLAGLDPLFGWKSLNLTQLLHEGERRAQALTNDAHASADDDPFLKQLNAICQTAGDVLDSPGAYKSPWLSILPSQSRQQDLMAEPQYFFSDDGTLAFLLVRPSKRPAALLSPRRALTVYTP